MHIISVFKKEFYYFVFIIVTDMKTFHKDYFPEIGG